MCEFRFRSSVRIIVESVISLHVVIIFFWPLQPPSALKNEDTTRKFNQALIYGLRTHKKNRNFSITLTRIPVFRLFPALEKAGKNLTGFFPQFLCERVFFLIQVE